MRWQQPAWAYRCHRDLGQPRWWRIVGSGRFPRPNKPPRRRWKYDWITPAQPGGSRCWRATGEEQRAQPNGHNPNVGSYVIDHPASDRGLCSCALLRLSPVPAFRLPVNRLAFGPFSRRCIFRRLAGCGASCPSLSHARWPRLTGFATARIRRWSFHKSFFNRIPERGRASCSRSGVCLLVVPPR